MTEPAGEPLVNRVDRDGVAVVELNRPARKNAIIAPMLDELAAAITSVNADPDAHAVLLCGAGGAFCSGLDLTEFNADPPPAWLATSAASVQAAHAALGACPNPIVVALERYAINGGAAFALAGDLIVSGRGAWLQVGEAKLGMQAPMNLAWLVARYPMATVMQVVLAGERITGPELHRLGIAYEVVADDEVRARAEDLAATIAAFPPGVARQLKTAAVGLAASGPVADDWFARAAGLAPPPRR